MNMIKPNLLDLLRNGTHSRHRFNTEFLHNNLTLEDFRDSTLLMYGAGESAHWFYEIAVKKIGLRPKAVIDRNASNIRQYKDIACINLEEAQQAYDLSSTVIVVCVGDTRLFKNIESELRIFGARAVLYQGWFYEIHNPIESPRVDSVSWQADMCKEENEIIEAYNLMSDEHSRQVFCELLYLHYFQVGCKIIASPRQEQYFPKGIGWHKFSDWIVCGAYKGEIVGEIESQRINVNNLYLFEPWNAAFTKLKEVVDRASFQDNSKKYHLYNYALSGTNSEMGFDASSGLGAKLSADGDIKVTSVTIDQIFPDTPISTITMDVEGEEPSVLLGAKRTIEINKPHLGVCVYHKASHLWELPNLIQSIQPDYNYYLRNYTSYAIESVLYARPKT